MKPAKWISDRVIFICCVVFILKMINYFTQRGCKAIQNLIINFTLALFNYSSLPSSHPSAGLRMTPPFFGSLLNSLMVCMNNVAF